jgi:hypothetical protein
MAVKILPLKNRFQIIYRLSLPNWYHSFIEIGIPTNQFIDLSYKKSQNQKSQILNNLIYEEIKSIKNRRGSVRVVDFFCADGYYSYIANKYGADNVIGIDNDFNSGEKRKGVIQQANLIKSLIQSSDSINFIQDDVTNYSTEVDLALIFGGLYHIEEVKKFLEKLKNFVTERIIIQTIYSLDSNLVDYLVTPAPGWTWGCRFSKEFLIDQLQINGWKIVKIFDEIAEYNTLPKDRGSLFLVAEKRKND